MTGVGDDTVSEARTNDAAQAPLALSTAQLRRWVAQQLHADVSITVAMYLDLSGPADVELLRDCSARATRELQSPHLRFRIIDGQPHQYLDMREDLPFRIEDLTGQPDPVAAAVAHMEGDYTAALDLLSDKLTVVTVYRVAGERHLLYIRSHHIVVDGVGAAAVLRRTAELYRAAVEKTQAEPAAARALSVAELLSDEQAYRDSPRAVADRAYWLEQLTGGDPVGLAGNPAPPAPRPHHVTATLDATTAQHLSAARERHGATFPELTIAAFACYLARMTGSDDVSLALPVAARTTAALRRSAGSMSNVVPLRLNGVGTSSVGAAIGEVRLRVIGALRHQRYRYEDMQRDRGQHQVMRGGLGPVVNVLGFAEPLRLGPLTAHARLLSLGPVEDLHVNGHQLGPDERAVSIDFQANPQRYDLDTVVWQHRMFLEYFGRFLAARSDCPIRALDPAAAAGPAVRPGVAPTVLLPDLLRAGTRPDAVALRDGERTMTYRELDEASSRWARELMAGGAGPGEFVVVAVPRSLESVLALWAVAKSGACFVPVDPTEPAHRIATIIADSGARQGLTIATVRRNLPCSCGWARRNGVEHGAAATGSGDPVATDSCDAERRGAPGVPQRDTQRARYVVPGGQHGIDWLVLDDPRAVSRIARRAAAPVDNADRARALRPGHPAYLIYTSGTTGMPKGVAVTHRGLGPLTGYITEHYGVHQHSVALHARTPSFDAHLLELFAAFAVGALLVIEPPSVVVGDALAQLIEDSGITHFLTTPAVLATLSPTRVPGLEVVVVVGGEACPSDLVRRWVPHVRLFNG